MKVFPNDSPLQVSVTILSQLVRYLTHLGSDLDEIFRRAGADPAILENPDSRIEFETYIAVEEEAARATGDPYFGLHMGEFAEPGSWSIVGYMMMNSRTLAEAFEKSGRYAKIIGNLIEGRPSVLPGKIRMTLTTPKYAPALSRHCFEAVFSGSLRMIRTLTGKTVRPLEVGFSYPAPASTSEYDRVFGCPVKFGCRNTYMIMPMSFLKLPVLQPNPELLSRFEEYAADMLERIDAGNDTTRRVTGLILSMLDGRRLSIGAVAREMAMSIRTLQLRLREEGTLFNDLLQETRERLAKKYLRENYSVEEITYLLGFSDPSVFRKAFKKWSGYTPKEYRRLAGSGNECA